MSLASPTMAQQIARAASESQQQRTGHAPESVHVMVSGETLVITLQGALSPAEQLMSQTAQGAAKVQEYHRQLFRSASEALRAEIRQITKVEVREATAEVVPVDGSVVELFTTGTMVQLFLLKQPLPAESWSSDETRDRQ